MKFQFLGATGQVTGSRHFIQADGVKLLVDCGMFQEREMLSSNWDPTPVRARDLSAVLITHAHLDHCGLLPKLVQEGFRGPIYATEASVELIDLVLRDSAHIQEEDALYKQKRHRKEGRKPTHPVKPLYTLRDVERTIPLLKGVGYDDPVKIDENVSVRFRDAGHILGSSIIDVSVNSNGESREIIFSGDIGNKDKPLVRNPSLPIDADYIVMESTYGDRFHQEEGGIEAQLEKVIKDTLAQGGNVVIPIFAIERAQEMVYYLSRLLAANRIPPVPMFLDSPMAANVTRIFRNHRECFDLETWEMITGGNSPLQPPGLQVTRTRDQSMAINNVNTPAIIMATSGMCTAGRIKFHLKRNISRPESTILFVGYQAHGTLGRHIVEGKKNVRIHGKNLKVRAQIAQIHGFSGHADRTDLLGWLEHLRRPPRQIFLVHGERSQAESLAEEIRDRWQYNVTVPEYEQEFDVE